MSEDIDRPYLSIGEVLGLLLEEFPDVTISKIRFLESQGLIDPERTPAGYRKFYDADVELLRVILREQRENFLPLRVIKDRIDSGQIDPSGEIDAPDQLTFDMSVADHGELFDAAAQQDPDQPEYTPDPVAHHNSADAYSTDRSSPTMPSDPSASSEMEQSAALTTAGESGGATDRGAAPVLDAEPGVRSSVSGLVLNRAELCAMARLTEAQLDDLESYGLVSGREHGGERLYDEDAVEVARVCVEFLGSGIDARHLKGWRLSAEREVGLYEQLVSPRLRQRSPAARAETLAELQRLDRLGARLRSALMAHALRAYRQT
jgi:DNA-binding transcriptional MerR regulator